MSDSCGAHCSTTDSLQYRRVVWICLISNLAMFCIQIWISFIANSVSLLVNSLDFFSDGLNYAITIYVLNRGARIKAYASLFKGISLAMLGLWAAYEVLLHSTAPALPDSRLMGMVSVAALIVNIVCAVLLYRFRGGDSNSRSIWICSRNDAIGNIAVMIAALGVFSSDSVWPDIGIAGLLCWLALTGAWQIIAAARKELLSLKP